MARTIEEKAAYDREYRAKNKARIAENKRQYAAEHAEQERARVSAWHAANAERVAEIKRAWKQRNPEADRQYTKANADAIALRREAYRADRKDELASKQRAYSQQPAVKVRTAKNKAAYRAKRPEVHRETARTRRRGVSHATPPWADKAAIKAVYVLARSVGMEVDHIIPLKGKAVCGLHVESNLQLMPPLFNRMKGANHAA